ncbi:hypothetical protein [Caproiciproducens faecalis]|uniref:Uncharacterized protein n=1 Tax=Caproiciproducens faecalis TaxID=2820301 RepID=A0ABS7DRH9_9FIRM|nr:hypothetical protein [Caproiciproducens faecalis]MBW7573904.1 hypothetical protein [Caproiciproducens faecalis]
MNGTYSVTLQTPFGIQKGTVTFVDNNGILSGSIRTMGNTSFFRNGKINGNSFEFSGILNAGFFNLRYSIKGTMEGDTLKAVALTSSGTFPINGTRVA